MDSWSVLLLVTLLTPAVGAAVILGTAALGRSGGNAPQGRRTALVTALLTFVLAALLVAFYPAGARAFAVLDRVRWLGWTDGVVDVRFSIGLDGLSLWLFGLTSLLMIVAVLVGWEAIREKAAAYYCLLLLLGTGMLGVFVARDIILFYVFFEFTLIPLFFLIGIWGHDRRRYAAIKFFLFTLAGSVLTFLGLLAIVLLNYEQTGRMTFSIGELTASLTANPIPADYQVLIFLALFAGFAIKVPLFPLHTWLPLAHVEAPTAGSVLLAGVLLKIGTYGFLRFSLPMLPEAAVTCAPWMLWLSVAGIIYGALVALVQTDVKRLIAYSSVSHLGFCMLGIFALNRLGTQGGVLQMINHGLSTGGLFALVGMLYERYHTREIKSFGGMARRMPVMAFFMLLLTFSAIGLPGLNGFTGEILILLGMFQTAFTEAMPDWSGQLQVIAVLAVSGVVLGAWYMLYLVQRVFFGPLREPELDHAADRPPVGDLSLREVLTLAPLAVFIFWIGLQPRFFLDRMNPTLDSLTDRAIESLEDRSLPGSRSLVADDFPPGPRPAEYRAGAPSSVHRTTAARPVVFLTKPASDSPIPIP
jgi:NADH-quinone oxidoreductase subunit M